MKKIFERIKDREWDWFSGAVQKEGLHYEIEDNFLVLNILGVIVNYSLADLLANKSWCKAVWFKKCDCSPENNPQHNLCDQNYWMYDSQKAFQILQQEGEQACIEYIHKTMI